MSTQLSLTSENSAPIAGTSPRDDPGSSLSANPSLELQEYKITGSIERVMYFNEETGQCVLDIRIEEMKSHLLVSGRVPYVHPGLTIETIILLTEAQKFALLEENLSIEGLFPGRNIQLKNPNQERTLRKFLKSDAFPEMGPNLAMVLAKALPKNLLLVIEGNPQELSSVKGVGKTRQVQIVKWWLNYKSLTTFQQFLFNEGLPISWGRLIHRTQGLDSLKFFRKSPYEASVQYVLPFELIDSFALRSGALLESKDRVTAAIFDVLHNNYQQGQCAYPEVKLLDDVQKKMEVPRELIEEVLEILLLQEKLIADVVMGTPCIYLEKVWYLEQEVAKRLMAFQHREPPFSWFNPQKVLSWAQDLLGIQLAPLQVQAIETALSSSLTVITGGPGTGKTTLIQSLVTILQTQFSKFALCSPTGRAAQRLQETTAAPAQTIHRLLKYDGGTGKFKYNQDNPLDLDLVLIDEMSMVDLELMSHLLNAIPEHCALIMVGDADQIPPVGAGHILKSVIDSGQFATVKLTDIFRQKQQSLIKINAHRINSGEMPVSANSGQSDFHYLPVHSIDQTKKVILDLVTNVIPKKYGITDPSHFQILVPMNRGALGTQQLNYELQQWLELDALSQRKNRETIAGFDQKYKTGDKVMVIKNDYKKDVYNGDIGFIHQINHHEQYINVQFDDRPVRFGFDELDRLTLAYAISIHKSQGSEYRAAIVIISNEHLPMAQRHLIYTAVTRGKEHVFLVADPTALQTAILSDENNRRWQKLTELLKLEAI